MNTKLQVIRFSNQDVISTSGTWCETYGGSGTSQEYFQGNFYAQNFTIPNDRFSLIPGCKTYDIDGKEVSGPSEEKWYHLDSEGNFHECDDETHHRQAPML